MVEEASALSFVWAHFLWYLVGFVGVVILYTVLREHANNAYFWLFGRRCPKCRSEHVEINLVEDRGQIHKSTWHTAARQLGDFVPSVRMEILHCAECGHDKDLMPLRDDLYCLFVITVVATVTGLSVLLAQSAG